MPISHTVLGTFGRDVLSDDVSVATLPDASLLCAFSAVTDDREEGIYVARIGPDGAPYFETRVSPPATRAFRPAVASASEGTAALAACIKGEDSLYGPWLVSLPHGGDDRRAARGWRRLHHDGDVVAIALGWWDADDSFLVAWEERAGAQHRVVIKRVDRQGSGDQPVTILDGARAPTLAPPFVAWIDAQEQVRVARLSANPDARTPLYDTGGPEHSGCLPDAVALSTSNNGQLMLAWHAQIGPTHRPDVLRWLRLYKAETSSGPWTEVPVGPGAEDVAAQGEDQGWEFPALLQSGDDVVLAGRSCQGWHVAAWRGDAYAGRVGISPYGWGGRGRTIRLAADVNGAPLVIRRESRGVAISRLDLGGGEVQPPVPATPAPLVIPGPAPRETAILFGDLHQHAVHSDACGTAESVYAWSRDQRALDFAALTEHDRFCGRDIGPATWEYLCQVANGFDEPGRFVTFRGFEFTGMRLPGPGHKCVYYGDSAPDRLPDKNVEALFSSLRDHGGIAIPHHVGWTGADMEHHDPKLQPVWEICSVHGAYECHKGPHLPPRPDVILEGQFVEDAMAAGLVFGLIGSTDSHGLCWHHGIHRRRDPFNAGLAAVQASEHTRTGILDAIKARRCYATTGARILLELDADGAPMGSELGSVPAPELKVSVHGHSPVKELAIVCDGHEVHTVSGAARTETSVRLSASESRPHHIAFARVLLEDGDMAWSSPIWWRER